MAEHNEASHFTSALSSAIFRLLLLLLLFIDAFLQYLGSKLARSCKLQIPCLLCSRIDNIWGNAKPGFFGDLICEEHRLETLSLAYCPAHQKLANVLEMCDRCLHSFANAKNSNPVSYKSLVSRACWILKNGGGDPQDKPSISSCSCCAQTLRNQSRINGLLERTMLGTPNPTERDLSVAGSTRSDVSDRGSECSEIKEKKATSVSGSQKEDQPSDKDPPCDNVANVSTFSARFEDVSAENPDFTCEASKESRNFDRELENVAQSVPLCPKSNQESAENFTAKAVNVSEEETMKSRNSGKGPKANHFMRDLFVPLPMLMDQATPTVADLGIKGSLLSPKFAEIVARRCVKRSIEDIKLVQSQILSSRMLDFQWNAPSLSPKISDTSSSSMLQTVAEKVSSEQFESTLESKDESFRTENVGDRAFEHLKRQVESDRKSMSILYKELEEERNASAIAANQAMAMINRLQEEKAAMQMEALHYLRMMEEQTEYDEEALQKANDLLSQREKEIQDLEAELECYRSQFGDEARSEIAAESRWGDSVYGGEDSGTPRRRNSDYKYEKDCFLESMKIAEERLARFVGNGEDSSGGKATNLAGLAAELSALKEKVKMIV